MADIIGTTLAGYTGERAMSPGPDWDLIDQLVRRCTITHPTTITRSFAELVAAQSAAQ